MPLTVPTYRLALDDLGHEHEVTITPGDQLRAETEGNRRGLTDPKHQSVMLTMLWLWAASRRIGIVDKEQKFESFVDRLAAWDRVSDDEAAATVDPTRPAGSSTPVSLSPPDSPASTGSDSSTTTPLSSPPPSDSSSPTTDPAEGPEVYHLPNRYRGDRPL